METCSLVSSVAPLAELPFKEGHEEHPQGSQLASPAQLPDPDRLQSVFRVPEPLAAEQPGHTPACPRRGWKVDSRPCPEPVPE